MPSLLREVLGDVLRQARITQGRTLRQVSDAARVSLGYLSEVERGRKEASSELLSAICDALDVPLSQLLTDAGEQLVGREPVRQSSKPSSPIASSIDASTKVVIPPVAALALSASA
jgi:transcriptional regulator with XRE-family HTH domain